MVRRSEAAPRHVLQRVEAQLQGSRTPRLLVAPGLGRPVTCGIFRPVILLPVSLLNEDRVLQLRQALLHELGHVQQLDGLGNLLFSLALPLLYFHPLYWILRRCSHLTRELVVDDLASRADGKEAYVEQLIELARGRLTAAINPIGSIGMFQFRSLFCRRIHMLLERRQPLATRCSTPCRLVMTGIVIAVVMVSASLIGVRPASAQPSPPDPAAKEKSREDQAAKDRTAVQVQKDIDQLVERMKVIEERLALLKTAQAQMNGEKGMDLAIEAAIRARDPVLVIDELTEAQISVIDQNLRKMLAERTAMLSEIASQQATGVLPENARLLKLQAALADEQKKIDSYVLEWRDLQKKMAAKGQSAIPRNHAPEPKAPPATVETARVGGVQLDLVQLGNSLVDASGAMQLAKGTANRIEKLREEGAFDHVELERARVNLATAEKRLNLLLGIADIALQGAVADLDRTTKLHEKGFVSDQTVSDSKSKVQMLEVIIGAAK